MLASLVQAFSASCSFQRPYLFEVRRARAVNVCILAVRSEQIAEVNRI